MDQQIAQEFNICANKILKSAYFYFATSTYFDEIMMEGFAKYMKHKASGELHLAYDIYDYLILRDSKLAFLNINEVDIPYSDVSEVFSNILVHEETMLSEIKKLFYYSRDLDDIAAMEFISKIIEERVKSAGTFRKLLFRIKNSNLISAGLEELNSAIGKIR